MPILTTRPVTPAPTTPSGAAAPLCPTQQRHPRWLGALRHRFRRPAPDPIQVPAAHVTRRARQLVQHEVALASVCQGVIAEVEQGVVSRYGAIDTTWRTERLAELMRTLPGVKQVATQLLAEEERAEQLQHHFQALLMAGTLDRLPTRRVEPQIVEGSGEGATPRTMHPAGTRGAGRAWSARGDHASLGSPGVRPTCPHHHSRAARSPFTPCFRLPTSAVTGSAGSSKGWSSDA